MCSFQSTKHLSTNTSTEPLLLSGRRVPSELVQPGRGTHRLPGIPEKQNRSTITFEIHRTQEYVPVRDVNRPFECNMYNTSDNALATKFIRFILTIGVHNKFQDENSIQKAQFANRKDDGRSAVPRWVTFQVQASIFSLGSRGRAGRT